MLRTFLNFEHTIKFKVQWFYCVDRTFRCRHSNRDVMKSRGRGFGGSILCRVRVFSGKFGSAEIHHVLVTQRNTYVTDGYNSLTAKSLAHLKCLLSCRLSMSKEKRYLYRPVILLQNIMPREFLSLFCISLYRCSKSNHRH